MTDIGSTELKPELARLRRGEREAELLSRSGADCYAATSSAFHSLTDPLTTERPCVDEAADRSPDKRPRWPGDAPFAVCLTHDVDNVSLHSTRIHARRLVRQLARLPSDRSARARRTRRSTAVSLIRGLRHRSHPDPLHRYHQWLEAEGRVGARSTFLFLPDRYGLPHYSDGGYRYRDVVSFDGQSCTVAEMMREIRRRGWEVGLHASWRTCDDVDEMKRQKEQVERAIDDQVVSVRHHNLHFDVRDTPRVHAAAGLSIDSSLGFNDDVGFRMGTSHPYFLTDLRDGKDVDVVELPLVLQDKCLLKIAGRDSVERAMVKADEIARRVANVGGVLTVLWHPGVIRDTRYVTLYDRLLRKLRDAGAWFGTMREIGEHWRESRSAPTGEVETEKAA